MAFPPNGIGPTSCLRLQSGPNATEVQVACRLHCSFIKVKTLTLGIERCLSRPPSLELRYLLRHSAFFSIFQPLFLSLESFK